MARLKMRIEGSNTFVYVFTPDLKDKIEELLNAVCPIELMSAERDYKPDGSIAITITIDDPVINSAMTYAYHEMHKKLFIKPDINYN